MERDLYKMPIHILFHELTRTPISLPLPQHAVTVPNNYRRTNPHEPPSRLLKPRNVFPRTVHHRLVTGIVGPPHARDQIAAPVCVGGQARAAAKDVRHLVVHVCGVGLQQKSGALYHPAAHVHARHVQGAVLDHGAREEACSCGQVEDSEAVEMPDGREEVGDVAAGTGVRRAAS